MNLPSDNKNFSTNPLIADSTRSRFGNTAFLMSICHEVRTPLNAIIGLSAILSKVNCTPEKRIKCAEMLANSSHMLMGLLNDLLDSSKINAGKMEIEHIHFNLAEVIKEALSITSLKAAEKGLNLQMHIGDKVPAVFIGDPFRICQILLNLLNNAIKFTAEGYVSISLSENNSSSEIYNMRLTVSDSGIGMREMEIEKIFEQYTQANAGISQQYGGTGLGLSISQELAHLMQGAITVKSSPGNGSNFTLSLPLKIATNQNRKIVLKDCMIKKP